MSDTPNDAMGAPVAKPSRKIKTALVLSLAVNLLVVGLIAGAAVRGGGLRRMGGPPDVMFGPLTEALTREDRKALRGRFMQASPDFRSERAQQRDEFAKLADLLRADQWDAAAAAALFDQQAQRGAARMQAGRRALLDYFASLSPEARKAMADRLEHGLE